jgi:F-type H+-transporting ATPase subunit gamma
MAGQLKEVRNRITSIRNSQQITKAMKMVSAAKLRRAQDAIIQMRPYAQKLQELLSNIVSSSEGDLGMSLAVERPVEKVLLVVITSDRGLAGAYNSNLIKLAKATIFRPGRQRQRHHLEHREERLRAFSEEQFQGHRYLQGYLPPT